MAALAPVTPPEKEHKSRQTLGERVTHAMFWNSVLMPVKTGLAFVSSIVVVRALSQTDYAIFGLVIAMLTTLGTYSDLGVENTLQKFLPEIEKRFGQSGLVRFVGALLVFKFAVLAVVLAGLYANWEAAVSFFRLGNGASSYLIAIALLLYLGILSDFGLEFLLTYFHQKATNSMDIVFKIVQPLLVVLFVWLGWGVAGVLYARVLATLIHVLLGAVFSRNVWRQLPHGPARAIAWGNVWPRFARLSAVSYFSNLIAYFSDLSFVLIVLEFYGNLQDIALFRFAFATMLSQVQQLLVSSLTGVPYPLFARLYLQRDMGKLQEAYASLSRFLTLMLVPSAVGLCLLAPNLIRLMAKSQYEPAAGITTILVITLFGESLFHPGQLVLLAFEENRIFVTARLITVVAIPLLFIYVPSFGGIGAALAIGLPRLLSRLYASAVIQHKFKLAFPARFFFKISFASALMAAVMIVALGLERPHDPIEALIRTVVAFALGSITFAIIFKRLGSIEASDKERLAALRIPFKRLVLNWL